MSRSTNPYADGETNRILKQLHNRLRPAGTPIERVEYIIELLLLRIFEAKLRKDGAFKPLRKLFEGENYRLLFSDLRNIGGAEILSRLNKEIFPFYASIHTKAREVVQGNLTPSMQDSLVLMHEVFANSNFTNNVQGGVLAEIIGMIDEIKEQHILKTDLLGDAIESALSETGGTRDFGLYRTPDHIRQMMVKMVDPGFTDTIFDPACGTAGFLFDAYDYIIKEAIKNKKPPSRSVADMFHRTGINGIEYQGRIRKMAAVNMYIRRLNPQNIRQGDSLKMYNPAYDEKSKSVILANPPFGAERDQPAYPNVWEEYSTESETTILFVKLMFDCLKDKGRCAVVVSEGFLTWPHGSACALRKMLLKEANLRAIISLPRGVFVTGGGQGAKTSILYFEKGQPTKFIWHYKIENDGYSMSTNREPVKGDQIPEALKLFNMVKHGKKPRNSKYSFCVDKEQIETLDPRVVEEVKNTVEGKVISSFSPRRAKLLTDLEKKVTNGRINQMQLKSELKDFDSCVKTNVNNEIAKELDKKLIYHFNIRGYRSTLSTEQAKEWGIVCRGIRADKETAISKRYHNLMSAGPESALQILASFNCENLLHMSIAEDYLKATKESVLRQHKKIRQLRDILSKNSKCPYKVLSELLVPKSNKICLKNDVLYKQIKIKLYGKGVLLRQEILGSNIKTQGQHKVSAGDFIMSKIDAKSGAFGVVPEFLDGAVVTSSFPFFTINKKEILPEYLESVVTQERFYLQIDDMVSGTTGRRSVEVNDFLSLRIPCPDKPIQKQVVAKCRQIKEWQESIDKTKQEIADRISDLWGDNNKEDKGAP